MVTMNELEVIDIVVKIIVAIILILIYRRINESVRILDEHISGYLRQEREKLQRHIRDEIMPCWWKTLDRRFHIHMARPYHVPPYSRFESDEVDSGEENSAEIPEGKPFPRG